MGDISFRQSPSPPPPPPPPIPRTPSPPLAYKVLFSETPDALPEPLPSIETIEQSPKIQDYDPRSVALVSQSYVVKYAHLVAPLEADTMRFVQQSRPNLRIPRIFALYQRIEREVSEKLTYIVMEKIEGKTLKVKWASPDKAEKLGFAQQLRTYLDSLRSIPHQGVFGGLNRSGLDLIAGMINQYERTGKEILVGGEHVEFRVAYFRQVLPKVFIHAGEPTFTHCDIQQKNIMVQPDGKIALIDWETSGWYPQYWVYAGAIVACAAWNDDWSAHVAVAMDEYPNHYAWMAMIACELWA